MATKTGNVGICRGGITHFTPRWRFPISLAMESVMEAAALIWARCTRICHTAVLYIRAYRRAVARSTDSNTWLCDGVRIERPRLCAFIGRRGPAPSVTALREHLSGGMLRRKWAAPGPLLDHGLMALHCGPLCLMAAVASWENCAHFLASFL